jgi:hypothetical protein
MTAKFTGSILPRAQSLAQTCSLNPQGHLLEAELTSTLQATASTRIFYCCCKIPLCAICLPLSLPLYAILLHSHSTSTQPQNLFLLQVLRIFHQTWSMNVKTRQQGGGGNLLLTAACSPSPDHLQQPVRLQLALHNMF